MRNRQIGFAAVVCMAIVAPLQAQGTADLRYVPGDARISYVTVDTMNMTSMGQNMSMTMRSVVELGIAAGDSGMVARGTLKELSAQTSTPMGEMPGPSAKDVEVTVAITEKGPDPAEALKLANAMSTSSEAGVLAQARALAALPAVAGRALRQGQGWVDTVHVDTEAQGIAMKGMTIMTGTYRADTTVNGRQLHILDIISNSTVTGSGAMQGTAVDQTMKMDGTIQVLWDPARHLPVRYATDMTMDMQMTAGAMNIDMQGKSRSVTVEGS